VKASKKAVLFLKKKPKKLLSICGCQRMSSRVATRRAQMGEIFFASFFSKKEESCLLPP
jgi:hypothetical protein